MKVERVKNIDSLPEKIEKKIRQRKKEAHLDIYLYENRLYISASLGQKKKAGYEINIREIKKKVMGEWEIMIYKKEPKKGEVVAQVINYPISIIKIDLDPWNCLPQRVIFKDKTGEVIKKMKLKEEVNDKYKNTYDQIAHFYLKKFQ